jgi:nucleoside-diphosphate-sugar epimerase
VASLRPSSWICPPLARSAGHEVVGLARSDSSAAVVQERGAEVVSGDLTDLDRLREAASSADGVIHLAFDHDAMRAGDLESAGAADLAAAQALAEGLGGDGKPFVGTSGTLMLTLGGLDRLGTEDDTIDAGYRVDTENFVVGLADRGIRSSVLHLPPVVHSSLDKHGFIPMLIEIARAKGRSGYVAEGANRWPAGHTLDVARLYRLALERAPGGSQLHAVDDDGIPLRQIAEAIGRNLDIPTASIPTEEVEAHVGFAALFVTLDTRRRARAPASFSAGSPRIPTCSSTSTKATTSRPRERLRRSAASGNHEQPQRPVTPEALGVGYVRPLAGGDGVTVERPELLSEAFEWWLAYRGPFVIAARIGKRCPTPIAPWRRAVAEGEDHHRPRCLTPPAPRHEACRP